jgi:hypothetical protein
MVCRMSGPMYAKHVVSVGGAFTRRNPSGICISSRRHTHSLLRGFLSEYRGLFGDLLSACVWGR